MRIILKVVKCEQLSIESPAQWEVSCIDQDGETFELYIRYRCNWFSVRVISTTDKTFNDSYLIDATMPFAERRFLVLKLLPKEEQEDKMTVERMKELTSDIITW